MLRFTFGVIIIATFFGIGAAAYLILGTAGLVIYAVLVIYAITEGAGLEMIERKVKSQHVHKLVCKKCGYDLRGNPTGRICPECGTERPKDKGMSTGENN